MARLVNILILFQIASKFIYFTIQMRNCDLLIFSYGCSKSRGRRERVISVYSKLIIAAWNARGEWF